jgi:serine/threonine protein kinase
MDEVLSPPKSNPTSTRKIISGISHYNFVKTVGQGQFGKVKLAIHQITKDKVILTCISVLPLLLS